MHRLGDALELHRRHRLGLNEGAHFLVRFVVHHDLARHLWDETRHCLLGEAAFASQGIDHTKIPRIVYRVEPSQVSGGRLRRDEVRSRLLQTFAHATHP